MGWNRSMITQRNLQEDPMHLAGEDHLVKEIMMVNIGELNNPTLMRRLLIRRGNLMSAMLLSIMARKRAR